MTGNKQENWNGNYARIIFQLVLTSTATGNPHWWFNTNQNPSPIDSRCMVSSKWPYIPFKCFMYLLKLSSNILKVYFLSNKQQIPRKRKILNVALMQKHCYVFRKFLQMFKIRQLSFLVHINVTFLWKHWKKHIWVTSLENILC